MQLGVAPPQTTPQAPQLALSLLRLVSQPFDGVPSQSPRADMEQVHEPIAQPVVPDEPAPPHAAAQAPQLVALVSRFTQVPEQLTVPAGQAHTPEEHTWPPVHAEPHAPQWVALVLMLVSQPSVRLVLQSPKPTWQVQRLSAQPPAEFDMPVAGHVAPVQAPQRAAVLVRSKQVL